MDIFDGDQAKSAGARRPPKRIYRVGVVLCPQHSLASIGLVMDVFRMANQLPGLDRFELVRVSENGSALRHPDGQLAVDGPPGLLRHADLVVVPSLWTQGDEAVSQSPALIDALRHLPPSTLVATLCTGAYLLAASGRLDGCRATTHWALAEGLQARFPMVKVEAQHNLTRTGPLICSGGSMAGMDACLAAVAQLAGPTVAQSLAQWLVTDLRHPPQSQYMPPLGWRAHQDPDVRGLQRHIEQAHAQVITLEDLAQLIHSSVRTLQRRFVAATGMTPLQYQQAVRIERSKTMLAQNKRLPVALVAERVGYQDRVAFTKLFKKQTGLTPAAYRQKQAG
jgi:AraC family transcriptional activator FtrA